MCNTFNNVDELLDQFSKTKTNIINTKKNDDEKTINDIKCSECQYDSLINDKGILYCNNCGVVCDIIIDTTPEWRFYGADDNKSSDPTRCGYYSNSLLPISSLGSIVSRRWGESYHMRKIRQRHSWNAMPYRERSLYNVFNTITVRARNSGISDCIIQEAKTMYKLISENKISRGANRRGLIASCIYIACKIKKVPRSSKEIADMFSISVTSMTKGCKRFMEIINLNKITNNKNINLASSDSTDFVHRFCSKLNMNKQLTNICLDICNKAEEYSLVSENTPPSIAAGTIYLVSVVYGLNLNKKKISQSCKISEVTICKCFKRLKKYYKYLFPEEILKK